MKKSTSDFLDFGGKNKNVLHKNGKTYVAIKPICTKLGIDYQKELDTIKEDLVLKDELKEIEVYQNAKLMKMQCLPEQFIYGWIFSLESEDEGLKDFKREATNVLQSNFRK